MHVHCPRGLSSKQEVMSSASLFLDGSSTDMWQGDTADGEETHTRTHSVFHLLQRAASTCGRTENRQTHSAENHQHHVCPFSVLPTCIVADAALLRRSVRACVMGMQTATCYYGYIITQALASHKAGIQQRHVEHVKTITKKRTGVRKTITSEIKRLFLA